MSSRSDWAAAFTAVRLNADLSIRELTRRTGIPSATLGGWFSGRNLPQAGQLAGVVAVLTECGITADEIVGWTDSVRRLRTGAATGCATTLPARPASPYPGLSSFTAEDSALFFGRDAETADILGRLEQLRADPGPSHGVLAVIGPSGSGKSSLLGAGLAAALAGRTDDDDPWTYAVMTPGRDPDTALARATEQLGAGTRVLVVDQFEEIFTAVDDESVRARFLGALTGPTLVVLGMRADFYAAAARQPVLVPVLQHAQFVLGPLGTDALRQAVVGPAAAVGVGVEDGLVDLVLVDAAPRGATGEAHDAGALPLLSHALLSAWSGGSGPSLTVADYRDAGGIDGAVQRTAEDAYGALDGAGRAAARALFLRLVHIGDDVTVTRRRVSGAELDAVQDDNAEVRAAVDEFVARRLLTAGNDSIEISHEALLSAWPRLRDWIDADRAALRLHRTITEASNAWAQADQDETLLLRGGRLETAVELADHPSLRADLNTLERDYVRAGVAAERTEREQVRRRNRRLRRLLASVAVLALVAGVLAIYSARARSDADSARRTAAGARDDALSRQVAIEARQLVSADPALAQQLALASYRISHTKEARGAVIDASARPVVTRFLGRFGYVPLALSAQRRIAAVGQATTGEVRLIALSGSRPRVVATLHPPAVETSDSITAVAFGPGARTLYVTGTADRLDVWDVADPLRPRHTTSVDLGSFDPRAMTVTPGGRELVVGGSGDDPVQRWDVSDPSAPRRLAAPGGLPRDLPVQTVAASADGRFLVAGGRKDRVYVWSRSDLTRPRVVEVDGNLVFSTLFTPGRLYVGHSGGGVDVVDPATGRRLGRLVGRTNAWALSLGLSPDGATIGVGSSDNSFRQYSTRTFRVLSTASNPAQVTGVAYLPDGSGVVLTCGNGATYVQPFRGRDLPVAATAFNLAFDRTGSRLMVASDGAGGSVQVWDVRGTPRAVTRPLPMTGTSTGAGGTGAISPDGTVAAAGNFKGQVQLYDLRDPRRARAFGPPFPGGTALVESMSISPDGRVLAVAGDDRTLSLWDIADPAEPLLLSRRRGGDFFYGVAFSPDGRMVAGANVDGHAYLWTITDPRRPTLRARLGGFDQEVWGVAFSRDSRLLAATGSDRTTRLWDVRGTGAPKADRPPLVGPTDYVYGASFNDDGTLLAVASNDRTVRLYDLTSPSRTPVETLTAVDGAVFGIAFSPDGRTLVASGRADAVAVWTTDPGEYATLMCRRAGDDITRAEWAQYVPGAAYAPPCR